MREWCNLHKGEWQKGENNGETTTGLEVDPVHKNLHSLECKIVAEPVSASSTIGTSTARIHSTPNLPD